MEIKRPACIWRGRKDGHVTASPNFRRNNSASVSRTLTRYVPGASVAHNHNFAPIQPSTSPGAKKFILPHPSDKSIALVSSTSIRLVFTPKRPSTTSIHYRNTNTIRQLQSWHLSLSRIRCSGKELSCRRWHPVFGSSPFHPPQEGYTLSTFG